LPPLAFTADELTALAAGARMVESWGGESMAAGARAALAKIASAMPADKRATIDRLAFFAPSFHIDGKVSAIVDTLHRAIDTRHIVSFAYQDRRGATTQRRVWPLALAYWGARFTLGAWCELREDFRHFALTNIDDLKTHEPFPDVEGKRLADFMRSIGVKPR
jgi:predicted DNA-binding transcriptional regulator YafY